MASVTYRIKGQYDNKAVKQAQNGLTALGNSVKQINNLMKSFVGLKVIQTVGKLASEGMVAFNKQNEALTKFNTAAAKANLNLTKLQAIQSKVSHNNLFDADSINNAMSLATELGLTENQIEKVMSAATDLASSGIMPLDQAVKSLSLSYSGNINQLKKIAPELSELTADELSNGKAVEALAKKYDGFSEAMATTFSGRSTQFKNSFDDLKAAIGSIPQSLTFITQGKILEPLNKITEWLISNRDYIINFFLHLPEVAQSVFTNIKSIFSKTWENLPEIISNIGPLIIDLAKTAFSTFFSIAKEAVKGIGEILDYFIGNPFRNSKDFINKFLNNMIEGINGLTEHLPKWVRRAFGDENGKLEVIKYRFSVNNGSGNSTWESTAKAVSDSINKAANAYKDGSKKTKDDWLKILNETKSFYGDDMKNLKKDLQNILGQDLPAELEAALSGVTYSGTGSGNNNVFANTQEEKSKNNKALSYLGEVGNYIQTFMNDGWKGVILQLVSDMSSALTKVSEIITNSLSVITYFIEKTIAPVAKILENWLAPVLTFISQLADITCDLFKLLEPILSQLGSLVIKTVLTVIITTLDLIYNAVVAIHNLFAKKKDDWDYRSINNDVKSIWDSKSNINLSSYGSSSSSSGASYTAAKDVYVTINFNDSLVYADRTSLAVELAREIKNCEKMNLV